MEAYSEHSRPLLSPLLTPLTLIVTSIFHPSKARPKLIKIGLFVGVWVVIIIGLMHDQPFDRMYAPTELHVDNKPAGPIIPHKIWQIFLSPPSVADKQSFKINPDSLTYSPSWLAGNPDYQHVLVGDDGVDAFLNTHFKKNATLWKIFHELRNTGMRSDLLRYLMLSVEGGVYADTDVEAIKPVSEWVPDIYKNRTRVIIGVEFDRLEGDNWAEVHEDMQFCQWTIAAAPGHPLFTYMGNRVVEALSNYTAEHNSTFSEILIPPTDVIKLTGPAAWTDAVFHQMQLFEPEFTTLRNLTNLREPRLIGDILLLPINGFGMGQPHSASTNNGTIPPDALVRHHFRGSWRHDGSTKRRRWEA